ncbi:MAG: metal-dependent hydrolase [Negativicutes bacterium]|nr:metal-dependent hydrolase [Negativicutes bacterium]
MLPAAHMGLTVAIVRMFETRSKSRWVDYRLLLAASLIPDMLDKPLAYLLFNRSIYDEGRSFGHSVAFLLLLGVAGLIYRLWRKDFLLATLFLGTAMHDILDAMWRHPGIFFWPLYGWSFPPPTGEAWQGAIYFAGLRVSQLRMLDTLGELLLLYFFLRLALNDKLTDFLKSGRLRY